jgi:hypothetical protein
MQTCPGPFSVSARDTSAGAENVCAAKFISVWYSPAFGDACERVSQVKISFRIAAQLSRCNSAAKDNSKESGNLRL